MATFPNAPGYRMALDIDGSVLFGESAGTPVYFDSTVITNLCGNGSGGDVTGTYNHIGWIFPELRDLDGYYIDYGDHYYYNFEVSDDTTNGVDGTWTNISPSIDGQERNTSIINGSYRTVAVPLTATAIIACRISRTDSGGLVRWHLYGKYSSGANPDRLSIWDPSSDVQLGIEALVPGTGGDVQRGQYYTKTFRVKNLSSTLTATNTEVAASCLSDNSPSVVSGIEFSINGDPYAPDVVVATLGPGAISNVITMKYSVDLIAQIHTAMPVVTAVPSTYA